MIKCVKGFLKLKALVCRTTFIRKIR